MARIGDPANTPIHPEKLTTKDAVVGLAYEAGVRALKKRKEKKVETANSKPIKSSKKAKTANAGDEDAEADPQDLPDIRQTDPLQGKIREPLPETNLERAMKW